MQFLSYYLWKCITDDGGLFLLILLVAAATGVLTAGISRLILSSRPAAVIGGLFAVISMPFSWWNLASLGGGGKTGPPEPASFAFVKEMKSDTVTCTHAAEYPLVIRIRFCGVVEPAMQERMLADLGKKNTYSGPKPVVVTFSPSPQVKEVVHPDGSKSTSSRIGKALREELLPTQPK